jgi:hypothetical protein
MASMTYYVALAFTRFAPNMVRSSRASRKRPEASDQVIRMARTMAAIEGHCGAIPFSRTGDSALGDFDDAVILKTGERG